MTTRQDFAKHGRSNKGVPNNARNPSGRQPSIIPLWYGVDPVLRQSLVLKDHHRAEWIKTLAKPASHLSRLCGYLAPTADLQCDVHVRQVSQFLQRKNMTIIEYESPTPICCNKDAHLKDVRYFSFLGSYVADSSKVFLTEQSWKTCSNLYNTWQSSLSVTKAVLLQSLM